jgi:alpha-amylase/alpha-mannosidase (GH57 family)
LYVQTISAHSDRKEREGTGTRAWEGMEGQTKRWIGHKRRKLSTQNYKKGKKERKDPAYGNENKEKYPN